MSTGSGRCGAAFVAGLRGPLVTLWRFPAGQRGRLPVLTYRGRVVAPRAELRLRELRVLALQPDAVGVALAQVGDEHLARVGVPFPVRDLEVDLEEGVGVAVEDGRH